MAKLTFTNDIQLGFVSSTFEGGVTVQCQFPGKGKQVVFVETRLGESLPWTLVRSIVLKPESVFIISKASEGQQYRLRLAVEPDNVETAKLKGTSSGGSGDSQSIEGLEDVTAEDIDDLTISTQDVHDIVSGAIANAEGNQP